MDLYMRYNNRQNSPSGYNYEFALTFPEFKNFVGAKAAYNANKDNLIDHSEVMTVNNGTERWANNYYIMDGQMLYSSGDNLYDEPKDLTPSEPITAEARGPWSDWKLVTDYEKIPTTVLEWVDIHS